MEEGQVLEETTDGGEEAHGSVQQEARSVWNTADRQVCVEN